MMDVRPPLTFVRKTGQGFSEVFEALARLRIAVFRDFPYLYAGTMDYEKTYLQTYADAERAFLFAVYDSEQMVGATTCIPLADETEEVQQPFREAGYDRSKIFYFGESILLPAYRGRGLYRALVAARLQHARTAGRTLATSHARESTSAPILERLGFATVCRFAMYYSPTVSPS